MSEIRERRLEEWDPYQLIYSRNKSVERASFPVDGRIRQHQINQPLRIWKIFTTNGLHLFPPCTLCPPWFFRVFFTTEITEYTENYTTFILPDIPLFFLFAIIQNPHDFWVSRGHYPCRYTGGSGPRLPGQNDYSFFFFASFASFAVNMIERGGRRTESGSRIGELVERASLPVDGRVWQYEINQTPRIWKIFSTNELLIYPPFPPCSLCPLWFSGSFCHGDHRVHGESYNL